ncbi:hypothetical protein LSUE1_G007781 [Lachnellula suecica]|uniref:DUF2423 domain-containing protein n=1 Tax=Lachnellula suecica TaxID=602035 RepID=A0A8T9BWS9_9HELO|nr:hypothetical protein LSUE1_G007781 [Lachnellula suecica]
MAKGARASTNKANNVKLKANVFGPVETARTERLSAKLLELASQPKPKPEKKDVAINGEGTGHNYVHPAAEKKEPEGTFSFYNPPITFYIRSNTITAMEIDQNPKQSASKPSSGRIEKKVRHKSSRKASIVFPKYKDGKQVGGSKGKKRRSQISR